VIDRVENLLGRKADVNGMQHGSAACSSRGSGGASPYRVVSPLLD